jgi:peptidoglycan/xylan/chitin deacetylase (PgdA/CDA1 family)
MRRCLPRFLDLLERRGIRATFFVIGEEVDPTQGGDEARVTREMLSAVARHGHELGNHTYRHRYGLSRMSPGVIADEIERAHDLISGIAGQPIVGFRAPGYGISAAILEHLVRLGYRYDSSILPSPPYYLAKALVLAAMAVVGRRSESIVTDPRALLAPLGPYMPNLDSPWCRGSATVVQLPISVTPWARIPVFGTSLLTAPRWLRSYWLRVMRGRPYFNLTFHGIDLVDTEQDCIPTDLAARQPGLRTPFAQRHRNLEAVLDGLCLDHRVVPLRDLAELVRPHCS